MDRFFKGVSRELKKKITSVSSTFLTVINAKKKIKVWVRLSKKFNLKPSSKHKLGWPTWNGLSRNSSIPASSPRVGFSPVSQAPAGSTHWGDSPALVPGTGKNHITRHLREALFPATTAQHPSQSPDSVSCFPPKGTHRRKNPRDQILKARIN